MYGQNHVIFILTLFLCLQTVNSDVSTLRLSRNWIDFEYGCGNSRSLFQNYTLPELLDILKDS